MLGPLLFLVCVSDIPEHVDSEVRMFADDTKIWRALITTFFHTVLQEDLNQLCEWSRKCLLKFHVGKCNRMHLGSNNPHYQYTMINDTEETILDECTEETDLGVWTSSNMKPSLQCSKAAATAMFRSIIWILKVSIFCIRLTSGRT